MSDGVSAVWDRDEQPVAAWGEAGDALPVGKPRSSKHPVRIERAQKTTTERDVDAEIVALAAGGHRERALLLLFQRHGPVIVRFCRRALRDDALAEDVSQNVLIQAHRDLQHFAGRSSLRGWLLAIAHNRVLDELRSAHRRQRWLSCLALCQSADAPPTPEEALEAHRRRTRLSAAVRRLPAHVRAALVLRYQHNLSFVEMEAGCGEKANTLQARVGRAVAALRDRFVDDRR